MPPIRPFAVALILASLAGGCGSDTLECPATGAVLLPDVPELQPEWGPGCIDSASWTADIEPANATWTVELRHDVLGFDGHVARLLDGVAVVLGTELILLDSEGTELLTRDIGTNVDWATFAVTEQGQMVISDQAGNAPSYRVLSPSGVEVWLKLLDVDSPVFARPTLMPSDDGTLWVGVTRFTPDFEGTEIAVQQWALTGGMQSEVVLPESATQVIARDGGGRFMTVDLAAQLFEPDGTPITEIELDSSYVGRIIGLDEGFVYGGHVGGRPTVTRIDGQGEIVWQTPLRGENTDAGSLIMGLELLPDGGVVAVGVDDTITVQWPDSPITQYGQPYVVALDEAGTPTWGERIAAAGRATAVTVGSQGEVYVVGRSQASPPSEYGEVDQVAWLRRYDP